MEMEVGDSSDKVLDICRTDNARSKIFSSSSDEGDEYLNSEVEEDSEWQDIKEGSPIRNEYSGEETLLIEGTDCNNPYDLFKLFFTDYILNMIVEETNKYATQCINSSSCNSRTHQLEWKAVSRKEMNSFIGILLIMGVIQLPEIRLYWSKRDMYANARIKKTMTRDRFLSILKYLHFSDNTTARTQDRLNKIRNIVEAIVETFQNAVIPGKNIVIDKNMVPWRGRLGYRQYIPGKRDKYGVKLYKSCLPEGYTYNIEIHAGKNETIIEKSHSHDVVMRLLDGIKWYRKVVIQLICGTSLVNAWYIHKRWGTKNMNMLKFRELIIDHLLVNEETANVNEIPSHQHALQSYEGSARESRKRCRECYKNLSKKKGRDYATNKTTKVKTFCEHCEGQPALCLKCFNKLHKNL